MDPRAAATGESATDVATGRLASRFHETRCRQASLATEKLADSENRGNHTFYLTKTDHFFPNY